MLLSRTIWKIGIMRGYEEIVIIPRFGNLTGFTK